MTGGGKLGPVGQQSLDMAKQGRQVQMDELGKQNSTLDQFDGPIDQSPYYRSLVTTGREGTAAAYRNAKVGMRQQAQSSGFGYEQPITAGAGDQINAAEASDLAKVPTSAMATATGPALAAAGIRTGTMNAFNPNSQLNTAENAYQSSQAQQGGLWSSLMKLGMQGLNFIPGIGPLASTGLKAGLSAGTGGKI